MDQVDDEDRELTFFQLQKMVRNELRPSPSVECQHLNPCGFLASCSAWKRIATHLQSTSIRGTGVVKSHLRGGLRYGFVIP